MDQFIDNFLNYGGFSPGIEHRDVPPETIEKYRGKLPDKLLEYWQTYGWRGWANGLFWTVDPEPWQPVVEAWLEDTAFVSEDNFYLIARSAFGKLFLWGEKTGPSLMIQAAYSEIFPRDCSQELIERGMDRQLQLFFSVQNKNYCDFLDEHEKPLFTEALKMLGALDHETMYGFVPALGLGGQEKLENLQKLDAVTHLVILAQMGEKRIMQDIVKLAGL